MVTVMRGPHVDPEGSSLTDTTAQSLSLYRERDRSLARFADATQDLNPATAQRIYRIDQAQYDPMLLFGDQASS